MRMGIVRRVGENKIDPDRRAVLGATPKLPPVEEAFKAKAQIADLYLNGMRFDTDRAIKNNWGQPPIFPKGMAAHHCG